MSAFLGILASCWMPCWEMCPSQMETQPEIQTQILDVSNWVQFNSQWYVRVQNRWLPGTTWEIWWQLWRTMLGFFIASDNDTKVTAGSWDSDSKCRALNTAGFTSWAATQEGLKEHWGDSWLITVHHGVWSEELRFPQMQLLTNTRRDFMALT